MPYDEATTLPLDVTHKNCQLKSFILTMLVGTTDHRYFASVSLIPSIDGSHKVSVAKPLGLFSCTFLN